jgi:hypothetical protein
MELLALGGRAFRVLPEKRAEGGRGRGRHTRKEIRDHGLVGRGKLLEGVARGLFWSFHGPDDAAGKTDDPARILDCRQRRVKPVYIVAIAWFYVVAVMAAAEDSLAAGLLTFVLYGLLPLAVIALVFGRRKPSGEAADGGVHRDDRADAKHDE